MDTGQMVFLFPPGRAPVPLDEPLPLEEDMLKQVVLLHVHHGGRAV